MLAPIGARPPTGALLGAPHAVSLVPAGFVQPAGAPNTFIRISLGAGGPRAAPLQLGFARNLAENVTARLDLPLSDAAVSAVIAANRLGAPATMIVGTGVEVVPTQTQIAIREWAEQGKLVRDEVRELVCRYGDSRVSQSNLLGIAEALPALRSLAVDAPYRDEGHNAAVDDILAFDLFSVVHRVASLELRLDGQPTPAHAVALGDKLRRACESARNLVRLELAGTLWGHLIAAGELDWMPRWLQRAPLAEVSISLPSAYTCADWQTHVARFSAAIQPWTRFTDRRNTRGPPYVARAIGTNERAAYFYAYSGGDPRVVSVPGLFVDDAERAHMAELIRGHLINNTKTSDSGVLWAISALLGTDGGLVALADAFRACAERALPHAALATPATPAAPTCVVHFDSGPAVLPVGNVRRSSVLAYQLDAAPQDTHIHCENVERDIGLMALGVTPGSPADFETAVRLLCVSAFLDIGVEWWYNTAVLLARHLFWELPHGHPGATRQVSSARDAVVVSALHRTAKRTAVPSRDSPAPSSSAAEASRGAFADRVNALAARLRTSWPCAASDPPIATGETLRPDRYVPNGPGGCGAQIGSRACGFYMTEGRTCPEVAVWTLCRPGGGMVQSHERILVHSGQPPYQNYGRRTAGYNAQTTYDMRLRERPEVAPEPQVARTAPPMPVVDVYAHLPDGTEEWVCSFPVP